MNAPVPMAVTQGPPRPPNEPPNEPLMLTAARRFMILMGALVLGLLVANVAVFANFVVFNFILHWGS